MTKLSLNFPAGKSIKDFLTSSNFSSYFKYTVKIKFETNFSTLTERVQRSAAFTACIMHPAAAGAAGDACQRPIGCDAGAPGSCFIVFIFGWIRSSPLFRGCRCSEEDALVSLPFPNLPDKNWKKKCFKLTLKLLICASQILNEAGAHAGARSNQSQRRHCVCPLRAQCIFYFHKDGDDSQRGRRR